MAKNYQADVNFLLNVPELNYRTAPKPNAYTHRIAEGVRKQLAAGVPVSRQAARGHVVTPEHGPRGARPRLPASARDYRGGNLPKSKYLHKTVKLPRPHIHREPINVPERIVLSDNSVVDNTRDTAEALRLLRDAGKDRVVLSGFDCETGVYRSIGLNRGHSTGWTSNSPRGPDDRLAILQAWLDSGVKDFEDWFISVANSTDSDPEQTHEAIGQVCRWTIHVYPVNTHLRRSAFAQAR